MIVEGSVVRMPLEGTSNVARLARKAFVGLARVRNTTGRVFQTNAASAGQRRLFITFRTEGKEK
jgi:hypothetical protein